MTNKIIEDCKTAIPNIWDRFIQGEVASMRVSLQIENQILRISMTRDEEDEIIWQQIARRYTRPSVPGYLLSGISWAGSAAIAKWQKHEES